MWLVKYVFLLPFLVWEYFRFCFGELWFWTKKTGEVPSSEKIAEEYSDHLRSLFFVEEWKEMRERLLTRLTREEMLLEVERFLLRQFPRDTIEESELIQISDGYIFKFRLRGLEDTLQLFL